MKTGYFAFIGSIFALCAAALLWPQPAAACAPYCNDPNWQHQQRMMKEQEQQQREWEYEQWLQNNQAPPVSQPMRPPPRYVPPPPPKGWQQRHSALVSFIVRRDEDDTPTYAYRIASNFPTEKEARDAAVELCAPLVYIKFKSDDLPENRRSFCTSSLKSLPNAYYSLIMERNGRFGSEYSDHRYNLVKYNNGHALKEGEKIWSCSDTSLGLRGCEGFLLGMGANGIFTREIENAPFHIAPCEASGPRPGQAIIGVDRSTGADKPLCGPDPDAYLTAERRGLYEGFATHPRYVNFWAIGGFRDVATAEAEAIKLCNAKTGGGCVSMGSAKDGFATVTRADGGKLFLGNAADRASAEAAARQKCEVGQLIPCRYVATRVTGDPIPRTPSNFSEKQNFAAAAMVSGNYRADPRIWASKNYRTADEAERAVLDRCRAENSARAACHIVARTLGGTLLFFNTPSGAVEVAVSQGGHDNGNNGQTHRFDLTTAAMCKRLGAGCKDRGSMSPDSGDNREPKTDVWELRKD